ncbi:sensor histidine kinase [Paenibacillus caui]|uniref:sensor histidine kinase n=1 Tax=Paenibacillus caui TaxID=2873927 RepID=UPI001CAA07B0|nr:HAMP domain-containing sensor histidine kinase [Paenibacillus caui]
MNSGGLRRKLLLSHLGVAISSLLLIVLLVHLVMTYSFEKYTENQQEAEAAALIEDLEASYNHSTGQWTTETLMRISHQAMLRDYIVRIYDSRKNMIWDSNKMGMSMHSNEAKGKGAQSADDQPSMQKAIMRDGQQIGLLEIQGIAGPFQVQNQRFLSTFTTLIWAALVLVIVGVYLFSVYISNGISHPLVQIKKIALRMREGDLSSRVTLANQTTEIEEVGLALNHLAEALEKQDKLRKNLTADIAHELRTPLAKIQSHIEAFQDGVWEATTDKLQVCHDQVIRLVQLISDLEKLTAAENPMLQLQKEAICLNEVIHDSFSTVAGQFKDKQISLNVVENKKVYMTGDYARLVQVFVNLLNNAYKYTNKGSIDVVVSEDRTEARVAIKDTGMGIASDELPFIFERFYRGEKSRNRKTGGAGIGLAVVKVIVEAHGGNITVQSKLDEGTEFSVHFPKSRKE